MASSKPYTKDKVSNLEVEQDREAALRSLGLPQFEDSVWHRLAWDSEPVTDVFLIYDGHELNHVLVIGDYDTMREIIFDEKRFKTRGTAFSWWLSRDRFSACMPSIPRPKPFVLSLHQQYLQFEAIKEGYNRWIMSTNSKGGANHILSGFEAHPECLAFELLQNAVDAGATEVSFRITTTRELIVTHNGRPFELTDVQALTNFATSSKRPNSNSIGYKGIGFKSVFSVTDKVTISSPPFNLEYLKAKADRFSYIELGPSFSFNSSLQETMKSSSYAPFSPSWRSSDSSSSSSSSLASYPSSSIYTSIKIQISVEVIARIIERIQKMMQSNTLLILASLDKRIRKISWKDDTNRKEIISTVGDIRWIRKSNEYSYHVTEVESSRYLVVRRGTMASNFICLCFNLSRSSYVHDIPVYLYTFLPLSKEKSKLLMDVHAPFVVDPLRQRVEPTKEKDYYWEEIGIGMANMMEALYFVLKDTQKDLLKDIFWRMVPPIDSKARSSFDAYFLKHALAYTLPQACLQKVENQKLLEDREAKIAESHIDISMLPPKMLESTQLLLRSLESRVVPLDPQLLSWISDFWGNDKKKLSLARESPFVQLRGSKLASTEAEEIRLKYAPKGNNKLQKNAYGVVLDVAWTPEAISHLHQSIQNRSFSQLRAFVYIVTHLPQPRQQISISRSGNGSRLEHHDIKDSPCSFLSFLIHDLKEPWIPCGNSLYLPHEMIMGTDPQQLLPNSSGIHHLYSKTHPPHSSSLENPSSIINELAKVPRVDFELIKGANGIILQDLGFLPSDSIRASQLTLVSLKHATDSESSSLVDKMGSNNRKSDSLMRYLEENVDAERLRKAVCLLYKEMRNAVDEELVRIFDEEKLIFFAPDGVISSSASPKWQWKSPKKVTWNGSSPEKALKNQYDETMKPFFQKVGVESDKSPLQIIQEYSPPFELDDESVRVFEALSRGIEEKGGSLTVQEVEKFVASDRFCLWNYFGETLTQEFRGSNHLQEEQALIPLAWDGLKDFSKLIRVEEDAHPILCRFVSPKVLEMMVPKLRSYLEQQGIIKEFQGENLSVRVITPPSRTNNTNHWMHKLTVLGKLASHVISKPLIPWKVSLMEERQLSCMWFGLPIEIRGCYHQDEIFISKSNTTSFPSLIMWALAINRPLWLHNGKGSDKVFIDLIKKFMEDKSQRISDEDIQSDIRRLAKPEFLIGPSTSLNALNPTSLPNHDRIIALPQAPDSSKLPLLPSYSESPSIIDEVIATLESQDDENDSDWDPDDYDDCNASPLDETDEDGDNDDGGDDESDDGRKDDFQNAETNIHRDKRHCDDGENGSGRLDPPLTPLKDKTPLKNPKSSPASLPSTPLIDYPTSSLASSSCQSSNTTTPLRSSLSTISSPKTPPIDSKSPATPLSRNGSSSKTVRTFSGSKFRQGKIKTPQETEEDGLRGAAAEAVALLYERNRLRQHPEYRSIPFLSSNQTLTSQQEEEMLMARVCSTSSPPPLPFLLDEAESLQFSKYAPWDIHSFDYIDGKWTRIRLEVKCSKNHKRNFYLSRSEYNHLDSSKSSEELPYIVYLYQDFDYRTIDQEKPLKPNYVLRFPDHLHLIKVDPTEYKAQLVGDIPSQD